LPANQKCVKLTLSYDGTDFCGWQVQPKLRTVQGEIENALATLTREHIRITGSGRTDTGVHALGQVAHFKIQKDLPIQAFKEGLNQELSRDVQILDAEFVSENFHARRDAIQRTYRYVLATKSRVIGRQYAWFPKTSFCLEPMKEASKCLLGEHDFTSFSKANEDAKFPVSHVYDISWDTKDEEIHFTITAIRFFHNMIRIIIGTLMEVGRSKMTTDQFCDILNAKDRNLAGTTAPPHGLFLVEVTY